MDMRSCGTTEKISMEPRGARMNRDRWPGERIKRGIVGGALNCLHKPQQNVVDIASSLGGCILSETGQSANTAPICTMCGPCECECVYVPVSARVCKSVSMGYLHPLNHVCTNPLIHTYLCNSFIYINSFKYITLFRAVRERSPFIM